MLNFFLLVRYLYKMVGKKDAHSWLYSNILKKKKALRKNTSEDNK